jgi:hypothetical protein
MSLMMGQGELKHEGEECMILNKWYLPSAGSGISFMFIQHQIKNI